MLAAAHCARPPAWRPLHMNTLSASPTPWRVGCATLMPPSSSSIVGRLPRPVIAPPLRNLSWGRRWWAGPAMPTPELQKQRQQHTHERQPLLTRDASVAAAAGGVSAAATTPDGKVDVSQIVAQHGGYDPRLGPAEATPLSQQLGKAFDSTIGPESGVGEVVASATWLDAINPVLWVSSALEALAGLTGSWPAAIMLWVLVVRVPLTPMSVWSMRNGARMALLRPEMEKLRGELQRRRQASGQSTWSKPTAAENAEFAKAQEALHRKHGINPTMAFLPSLVQMPFFIVSFMAIRFLTGANEDGAAANAALGPGSGWLWFSDLSVPDPYLLLPIISVAINLVNLELGAEQAQRQQQNAVLKNVMRGLMCFFGLIATKFPAGMVLYWVATAAYSTGWTILTRRPAIKAALGIPVVDVDTGKAQDVAAAAAAAKPFVPLAPLPQPTATAPTRPPASIPTKKRRGGPRK